MCFVHLRTMSTTSTYHVWALSLIEVQPHSPLNMAIQLKHTREYNHWFLRRNITYCMEAKTHVSLCRVRVEYLSWREGYLLLTLAWKIICRHFDWMLQSSTGRNIGKLFSELKLVTDNLLFIYTEATERVPKLLLQVITYKKSFVLYHWV